MNYFIELNPNYKEKGFDYNKANPVDGSSQRLIENMCMFMIEQLKRYDIAYEKCDVEIYCNTYGLQVDKIRLTCDYLGPSMYYVAQQFANLDVLKLIIDTRMFGAHIVWPSSLIGIDRFNDNGKEIVKSINTARSYCLRERLDYILFEIREWYINGGDNGIPIFQKVLDGNRYWFEKFGQGEDGYKKFINVFAMNDIVAPDTFEPFDFELFNENGYDRIITKKKIYANDYIPKDKRVYKNYINATIAALRKRDERIKSYTMFQNF